MPAASTTLRTLDGLHLAATLVEPEGPPIQAIVLVHGGGVTREEGGFFTRLATGLAEAGIASLRFDLRGHGQSEGRQEDLTISAMLNDIQVAMVQVRETTGASSTSLLGASFAGGACAYYAAKRPAELARLVLFNPQLNYKRRSIDNKPYWQNDRLTDEAARQLADLGYLQHNQALRHGRAFYNELFWLRPDQVLGEVTTPTLIVHGTRDTFVPIEASREAVEQFGRRPELVEIEGSQHGFAVHDDPQYLNPQSQAWQAFVIQTTAAWLTREV